MSPRGRLPSLRSCVTNLLVLGVVSAATLAVADLVLIATGLFPPRSDPGDATVGWLAAVPTGAMHQDRCLDLATGAWLTYQRNEDGVRTSRPSAELAGVGRSFEVVVSGDSHTDLCMPNDSTHFGRTEARLAAAGTPSAVYAYGAGKYSPLQAYLAIAPLLPRYQPDAFVLNLYTGNDFYDMMRVDDRPHFVPTRDGYDIAPPVWYQHDPPGRPPRSRVRFAARELAQAVGLRNLYVRLGYLRETAAQQGRGISTVVRYMNDLRRASAAGIGYPQAYSAQMLNQQLFFHRFPGSREESVRRVEALLRRIRSAHPDLLLVLSPIPSYQAVLESAPDSVLGTILQRLPLDFAGGVAEESALYDRLRTLAAETGWVFVDNLGPLRRAPDRAALYNRNDLHVTPTANEIIAGAQADALRAARQDATARR